MNGVFVDTSFLIAVMRTRDQYHQAALSWKRAVSGPLITTEYVLIEFMDASAPLALRSRSLRAIQILRNDAGIFIVPATTAILNEGLALFESRSDKEWGLTDCISFAVMQARGIRDALSSDRHFEQAGFRALLRVRREM